jgi:hypothetical protein
VADILAAARAGKAAPAPEPEAPPQAEPAPAAQESSPESEVAEALAVEEESVPAKSTEKVDKSKMTIDDILAWCREHDAK